MIARRRVLGGLAAVGTLAATGPLRAQAYPGKPVKIVVGLAAGGATDLTARILAQALSERLGRSFVVENRPGAGTTIASQAVARSAPDGYTLLMITGSFATSPAMMRSIGFDPVRDFAPIVRLTSVPFCIAAHPGFGVRTVGELIARAKANPGKLSYASSGTGGQGHLAGELFNQMAGTDLQHIAYRGASHALNDVLSGDVPLTFTDLFSVLAKVKTGEIALIGVTSDRRAEVTPEIPTVAESGLPGYEVSGWAGLVAPAGTPAEVIGLINAETNRIIDAPDMRRRMADLGAELIAGPPESFGRWIDSELTKWRGVIRTANIPIQD